jgi:hypothetical protein
MGIPRKSSTNRRHIPKIPAIAPLKPEGDRPIIGPKNRTQAMANGGINAVHPISSACP